MVFSVQIPNKPNNNRHYTDKGECPNSIIQNEKYYISNYWEI